MNVRSFALQFILLVLALALLVALPFAIWGDDAVLPWVEARSENAAWLVSSCVLILAIDAVLPVPTTLVIAYLAAEAGVTAGIVGGAVGLTCGVVLAWGLGQLAIGRLAPRWFSASELARIKDALQHRAGWTLIMLRPIPVAAETSVMIAGGSGMGLRRILLLTLAPNLAIAVIYSLAGQNSLTATVLSFVVTIGLAYAIWRRTGAHRPKPAG